MIVGHSPDDHVGDGRRDRADLVFTSEQVAATLDTDSFDDHVSEVRERTVLDAEGGQRGLCDTVVHARRRR